jgi:hypothetical protein
MSELHLSPPPLPSDPATVRPSAIGSVALTRVLIGPAKVLPCLTGSHISKRFLARDQLIALMIEAASTSETSVNFYQTTRCNNPEDSHLQLHNQAECVIVKCLGLSYILSCHH